jgi:hypothetical protein
MLRTPRIVLPAAAVALVAVVVLVAASTATGRSQEKPKNTVEPSILWVNANGIKVGTELTGDKGNWTPEKNTSYAYQWLRCNDNGESCQKITNATGTTYKIVSADAKHTIRLDVTATNGGDKTTARANATSVVPANPNAPYETAPPQISGQAVVGKTLTATTGSWKGTQPISYTFKWQSCTSNLSSCPGNGATGNTYTVAAGDVGKRIRVKVIAKNSDGQTPGLSDPTAIVSESGGGGGGGGGGNGSSVPVSSLVAGDRLVVDTVSFSPNPVTSTSQSIRVTIKIKDNKGKLVKGAFVSIVSTPVVTSTPDAAQTDSNGIVVYTIQPKSNFPIRTGYSVQFYVKGYREGDPTLAGVSGGRLVQVGTKSP